MKIKLCAFVSALLSLFCSELHAGNLKVNLAPAQAVSAGAQWRVDGGSWKNSGTTVKNLSNTTHQVTFKTISGWITPTPVTVAITSGNTTTLNATYVQSASLKINLTPTTGQWRVDGGAWQASGTTASGLTPNSHLVEYAALAGYSGPAAENVSLTAGQTTTLSRSYTQLAQLSVTLTPSSGQWSVDGGAWQASGATVANLDPGAHSVSYSSLANYSSPANESVSLASGQSLSLSRNYVQLAQISINLVPSTGQWRANGGAWQAAGSTLSVLPGDYLIEYAPLALYDSPASETITLTEGGVFAATRTYTPIPAQLTITLDPASAQWRVDAGTWQASGVTVSNLTPGDHAVEYQPLNGYTAPLPETVTLSSGVNTQLTRSYTAVPAYSVITAFKDFGNLPTAIKGSDGLIYCAASTGVTNGLGHIVRMNPDGSGYQLLKRFGTESPDGLNPKALLEGSDGVLYGTTLYGTGSTSTVSNGKVYRINKDGSGYALLWSFDGANQGRPNSLIEGSDGVLYGTTTVSAPARSLVFRINRDGAGFTILRALFSNEGYEAQNLTEAPDGTLYGIARSGGPNGYGSIFKLNKDGSGFVVVKGFAGGTDGRDPRGQLIVGSDGLLYGSTYTGGSANRGVLFRLNLDGSGYQIIHDFLAGTADGAGVEYPLTEDATGVLHGLTVGGGASSRGTQFKLNKDGTGYALLRSFTGGLSDGGLPRHRLVPMGDGTFLGATTYGGPGAAGVIFRVGSDGANLATILPLGSSDGSYPWGAVTQTSDGQIFGTTHAGGAANLGTVFRVAPDSSGFSVLHNFAGTSDGGIPIGRVFTASNGALYGTTLGSSANGTLYRLQPDGSNYSVLHIFDGAANGLSPWAGVTEASDGALYGTASGGGSSGNGLVYRINKDGSGFSMVHDFAGGTADGSAPQSDLLEGNDGRLYGTTYYGGAAGVGVVYVLNKDGSGFSILHHFSGGSTDGASPVAGLTQATDGLLYGLTNSGGSAGVGTAFRLNTSGGVYEIIRDFAGGTTDGATPTLNGLIEKNGLLYGATVSGGTFNKGTLFRMNRDGSGFAILINFGAGNDDAYAPYNLSLAQDGALLGTASQGPVAGAIFRFRLD